MKTIVVCLLVTLAAFTGLQAQDTPREILFDDCYELETTGITFRECFFDGYDFVEVVDNLTVCTSGSLVMTGAGTVYSSTVTFTGKGVGKNGNHIPLKYTESFTERNIYRAGENGGYIVTWRTGGVFGGGMAIEADVSTTVYTDGTLRTELRNTQIICR